MSMLNVLKLFKIASFTCLCIHGLNDPVSAKKITLNYDSHKSYLFNKL